MVPGSRPLFPRTIARAVSSLHASTHALSPAARTSAQVVSPTRLQRSCSQPPPGAHAHALSVAPHGPHADTAAWCYSRLMSTVTVWPPGLIVSGVPRVASPDASTGIVTLWTAVSVPAVCERLMLPSSPDGTEMDQLTVPPLAVSVNEAVLPTASAILLVDTESVPWLAPELDDPDGDGLGEAEADGDADPEDPEDDAVGDAEAEAAVLPPVPRPDDGAPDADAP